MGQSHWLQKVGNLRMQLLSLDALTDRCCCCYDNRKLKQPRRQRHGKKNWPSFKLLCNCSNLFSLSSLMCQNSPGAKFMEMFRFCW